MSSLLNLVSVSGLLDAALKSAAVVLLAAAVAALLGWASAAWRHLVWCLSVMSLLLLPVFSLVLPELRVEWLPRWTAPPKQLAATNQTEPAQSERAQMLDDAAIVVPRSTADSKTERHREHHTLPPTMREAASPPRAAAPWLAIAWAAGGLLSLVPLAIGLWQLVGLHRRSQAIGDRRWLTMLDELRRQLVVRRSVQLRQCPSAQAPLTWGALRPVLLVPFEADAWPDERRRLVLWHELAHVLRWDWLTQQFAHVACAAYWFNPLVWWAARQMRIERERACDDIVLSSGARPSDYARELLALATARSRSQVSTLAAVPMAHRTLLDDRLRGILDSRRRRSALTKAAVCLGAVLAATTIAPLAMLRAAPSDREPGTRNGEQGIDDSRAVATESAGSEIEEPKRKRPAGAGETLEMAVNTSRILSIGKPVPRAHVSNPELAEITVLSPSQIQVRVKKPGTTQIHLFDEDNQVYTVDTFIYADARELRIGRSVQQTAESKKKPLAAPVEMLEMTVNTSRILTTGKPVPRAQAANPDVAEITALSPTQIQVRAKKPGTTEIHLFDEDENIYTADTIVYPDARELRLSLRTQLPMNLGAAGRQVEREDNAAHASEPLTLVNSEVREIWDLTLEEAVRSALANSKVLRNMGGLLLTPVAPQSNLKPAVIERTDHSMRDPEATGGTKVRFVLARTREDITPADFKSGVRAMLSDVERAYWDLYYHYRNLNAVQAARDSALATWRKVYALLLQGNDGGEAEKEAQAREQYFLFRAQVENTLGLLYTAESRLRYMMGVTPTDGRLIRPAAEPTTREVRFDLKEIVSEALHRDVELSALSSDEELELAHVLTNCLRDLDRNYQVSITTRNRRKSAAEKLEAVKASYDAGTATLDMLLDAQRRLADAEIAYYRALVDYNVAILQVHFRKNSLLEYNGIMLAEGTRAGSQAREPR